MMHRKSHFVIFLFVVLPVLLVQQCATPTQPSGGPPDRTPPVVQKTEPATGSTMFDGDRIRFRFSKYVDRNSFRDAFRMEPDLNLNYEVSWSRRTATVRFDEPLPDTTTIIFTLGTDLSDTRNNRISSPFQLALSTGPEIDEGRITATVRDAETGEGMMGERVMLYRFPVDLEVGADYVGESDSSGVVRFNYLREGTYKAFWLDDRNRNRRWDRDREAAQPFRKDSLELSRAGEEDLGTVYVVKVDTVAPVLQAVGMHSDVRLRLRFSEEVIFEGNAAIDIYHEDDSHASEAVPLYIDADNPNVLLAQARNTLPDGVLFRIEIKGVTDPAGNPATIGIDDFPGSDVSDTTFARYIGNDTRHGIFPDEPVVIRYAKLLYDTPEVLDSLVLLESQATYDPWPHAEIIDNLLAIYPDGAWDRGENYEIRIWDEELMESRTIQPIIHFEEELGGLSVLIEEPATDSTEHRLELVTEQGVVKRTETFLDEIELSELPAGRYVLTVYELRNDTQRWDPGKVDPFRPPARYFIQRDVPVEQGMTGQVYVEWK